MLMGEATMNEQEIRATAAARLKHAFGRQVRFQGSLRDGSIHYEDGSCSLRFCCEMGGGDVGLIVHVPDSAHWSKATGLPADQRHDVLDFVARCTQREQAPHWRYEIGEREILFFVATANGRL